MFRARALGRQREVGIRLAMGAGRWRLARQFLAESVLLSLMGGALGLLWAGWGVRSMIAAIPAQHLAGLPFLNDLRVDPGVLAFTFAVCVATGLLFGLMPAFQTSSVRVTESLKTERTSALIGVATLACFIPAHRAPRLDPLQAVRHE